MNNMIYSSDGLHLTESFEGCRLTAYADPLAHGIPTVGYGHTGPDVVVGAVWTQEQCEAALQRDILWAATFVNKVVHIAINQEIFDSLTDFTFNAGVGSFLHSTLLVDLNAGNLTAASLEFDKWSHAGGHVVAGLLRRRQAETDLFNKGTHDLSAGLLPE